MKYIKFACKHLNVSICKVFSNRFSLLSHYYYWQYYTYLYIILYSTYSLQIHQIIVPFSLLCSNKRHNKWKCQIQNDWCRSGFFIFFFLFYWVNVVDNKITAIDVINNNNNKYKIASYCYIFRIKYDLKYNILIVERSIHHLIRENECFQLEHEILFSSLFPVKFRKLYNFLIGRNSSL